MSATGPAFSITQEIPFSVSTFAAMPPEWPEPMISTSTSSSIPVEPPPFFFQSRRCLRSGLCAFRRLAAIQVRIHRIPVHPLFHAALVIRRQRVRPRLGVDRCGAYIAMRQVYKLLVRIVGGVIGHPCTQPWPDQCVGLLRIHSGKGNAELFSCLGVQPVQAIDIHLLPVRG